MLGLFRNNPNAMMTTWSYLSGHSNYNKNYQLYYVPPPHLLRDYSIEHTLEKMNAVLSNQAQVGEKEQDKFFMLACGDVPINTNRLSMTLQRKIDQNSL